MTSAADIFKIKKTVGMTWNRRNHSATMINTINAKYRFIYYTLMVVNGLLNILALPMASNVPVEVPSQKANT